MKPAAISEPRTPQVATASKPSNEAEPKAELAQDTKSAVTGIAELPKPSTSVETDSDLEQTYAAYEDNFSGVVVNPTRLSRYTWTVTIDAFVTPTYKLGRELARARLAPKIQDAATAAAGKRRTDDIRKDLEAAKEKREILYNNPSGAREAVQIRVQARFVDRRKTEFFISPPGYADLHIQKFLHVFRDHLAETDSSVETSDSNSQASEVDEVEDIDEIRIHESIASHLTETFSKLSGNESLTIETIEHVLLAAVVQAFEEAGLVQTGVPTTTNGQDILIYLPPFPGSQLY
jgi:hypothetical protein